MNWNKKTKILYSPRRIERSRQTLTFATAIVFGALVFAFAYGIYWFFNYQKLHIQSLRIHGAEAVAASDIERVVREYMSERVWGLFPRSNYALFSSDEASGRITKAFLRVSEAHIEKTFPDLADVTIRERMPWGIVCNGTASVRISSSMIESDQGPECIYVDQSGFAYEHSPVLFGALTKKIFLGDENAAVGGHAVPDERLRMYDDFKDHFSRFALPITAMAMTKENPRDVHMYVGDWYVLVDRDSRAEDVARVLRPLLEQELSGKMSRIDYIDLRFGNKVFYRLKK